MGDEALESGPLVSHYPLNQLRTNELVREEGFNVQLPSTLRTWITVILMVCAGMLIGYGLTPMDSGEFLKVLGCVLALVSGIAALWTN